MGRFKNIQRRALPISGCKKRMVGIFRFTSQSYLQSCRAVSGSHANFSFGWSSVFVSWLFCRQLVLGHLPFGGFFQGRFSLRVFLCLSSDLLYFLLPPWLRGKIQTRSRFAYCQVISARLLVTQVFQVITYCQIVRQFLEVESGPRFR